MAPLRFLALCGAALALQGCVAKAMVNVATLPVRAMSRGVDAMTTSQSEADQNRGRTIRQREERLGALQSDLEKQAERCEDGNDAACGKARALRTEIRALMPTIPLEPDGD
jgi:hypothetical protein